MSNQSNTSNNNPRTVQDIIRAIETKSAGGGYIYRGEPECHKEPPHYGKVSSSLWREYGIGEVDIEVVQAEMLSAAKKHIGDLPQDFRVDFATFPNVAEENTDKTINFEILTQIQHYGGATNLIDFTTDYFIALFFACDGHHDERGRVILQKTEEIKNMINHPRNPRHRVIAQKSVFVRPPKGFIEPHEDDIVTIPANLKQSILHHLLMYHGISTETIYNDLYGFIRNQDIHGGAYTEFYRGLTCQKRGNEATNSEAKQKEYEKSIGHYTKAIGLKPDFAEAYYNRGAAYSSKGDFERGIDDFNKAIDLDPDNANAYYNRGSAYSGKGDFERGIDDFNKAIDLNPNYADAYNNRGNAYTGKGDYDRAIADFNKAIDLDPDNAIAYTNSGLVYEKQGDIARAIDDYTQAIQLKPDNAIAYYNRGIAYGKQGDIDRAIDDYTQAIQLKPDFAEAHCNRGSAYSSKGDFDRAIEDCTQSIQLKPNDANAYYNRGSAYSDKGDVDRAIEDYTRVIELNPNDANAYFNRGRMWLHLRESEKAKSDLMTARDMGIHYSFIS